MVEATIYRTLYCNILKICGSSKLKICVFLPQTKKYYAPLHYRHIVDTEQMSYAIFQKYPVLIH